MKRYSIKALATLSGVSIRTLRYYDAIGLLAPMARSEAGYRFYGEAELLRLQQILFYRELDFSLKEIQALLDDPEFDLITALESHREALQARRSRIAVLLDTLDHTLSHLKSETEMTDPEMLYQGLPKDMRAKAIDEYGEDAIQQSEVELLKLGKAGFARLKAEQAQVTRTLFALRNEPPQAANVQKLIARHYEIIRQFWGTSQSKDSQAAQYLGLGSLYIEDDRFLTLEGEPQPGFAQFMKKAMTHFAKTSLGLE